MWWRKKKPVLETQKEPILTPPPLPVLISAPPIPTTHRVFDISLWVRSGDAVNGISFGETAMRHGRYEIAIKFFDIGIDWYEKNVVRKRNKFDTPDMRQGFREHLKKYRSKRSELDSLLIVRPIIIDFLRAYPNGILRKNLVTQIPYEGTTKMGVICNQLAKGDWITQDGEGAKTMLFLKESIPESDDAFVARVIPAPGRSGLWQ